jgi:hypothetical protein
MSNKTHTVPQAVASVRNKKDRAGEDLDQQRQAEARKNIQDLTEEQIRAGFKTLRDTLQAEMASRGLELETASYWDKTLIGTIKGAQVSFMLSRDPGSDEYEVWRPRWFVTRVLGRLSDRFASKTGPGGFDWDKIYQETLELVDRAPNRTPAQIRFQESLCQAAKDLRAQYPEAEVQVSNWGDGSGEVRIVTKTVPFKGPPEAWAQIGLICFRAEHRTVVTYQFKAKE